MTKDNTEQREGLQQQAQKLRKQKTRQMIVSLIGIAILLFGLIKVILIFINYATTESSNDAQIEQYISPVNLRASGYIKKIYFQEHQRVKKGDTLLVLDDREYLIRLMEAEAALKDAMAGANVISATLNTTETSASVYDASIAEIEVRLEKLAKDRQRYQNLVARNAATPIQLEQIETEYVATKKKLDAVQKQKKAALSGVTEVERRKANSAAAIERTTAALEMAKLNLSYTVVLAPYDGTLGRRAMEEGQKFTGKVTAISAATGAKYSLVPTDNSAGNFVKIQQRVPVRIDFTNLSKEDNESLAAGMMAIVQAKIK